MMSDPLLPDTQDPVFDNTDNIVQPFQLEQSNIRGRIVRLGSVLDDILSAHDYPDAVNQLVGETLMLCALLSSMLKYEGIFTLQTQGDGPIGMLVADITSAMGVRGCAHFDNERLEAAVQQIAAISVEENSQNHLAQLLGKGHIAFTVDQGEYAERYQGIVELKGSSLVDCVQHYFTQSEQINTGIKMAVGRRDGKWRASGIMLQTLPEENPDREDWASNIDEDSWRRSMILLDSCTEDEFLSPDLGENMLLVRLFHEEGVRIFESHMVQKQCRCSMERVENILIGFGNDDLDHITKDGQISMKCEFCSHEYTFDVSAILQKIKDHEVQSPNA